MNKMEKNILTLKVEWPMSDNLEPDAYRINQLIDRFDEMFVEMEKIWGVDRLPLLVSQETSDKWKRHLEKLNEAIVKKELQVVSDLIEGAKRGIKKMDQEARQRGNEPHGAPVGWTVKMPSGGVLAVVGTGNEAAVFQAMVTPDQDMHIYSLKEVANIIEALNRLPAEKREAVFKATLNPPPFDFEKGDDIPF